MERKEMILLAVVILLVVTATIQTIQLVKLGSSPVVAMQSVSATMPVSGGQASVPTSLDSLPSMVGGC